jgi:integrase
MGRIRAPRVPDVPVPIPPLADIRAVLAIADKGRDFEAVRDAAIIRIWCEPGSPRASEMANLSLAQADLETDEIQLQGKGGKYRSFPLSARTARALARYVRARRGHPTAATCPRLFLGRKGPMTRSGMYQMIERRCDQADVPRIHPHQFRHYATDAFLAAGGRERDLMRLNGWSSPAMLSRYGAAAATRRATAAARALALGNEL